jgi:hypothetical protein
VRLFVAACSPQLPARLRGAAAWLGAGQMQVARAGRAGDELGADAARRGRLLGELELLDVLEELAGSLRDEDSQVLMSWSPPSSLTVSAARLHFLQH